MSAPETKLSSLPFWPKLALANLQEHWLDSAEQLVALGKSETGRDQLSVITGLQFAELNELLAQTRRALSAETLKSLDSAVDTQNYGLGAIRPAGSYERRG
jgi:hypothetical protein